MQQTISSNVCVSVHVENVPYVSLLLNLRAMNVSDHEGHPTTLL